MQVAKQKIADLLEETIGFNVTSIGGATFLRALETRMKDLGVDDCTLYFNQLLASDMELRKLIEEVVVPETWFFRDQGPFEFLTEYILKSKKVLSNGIFRILSLPSSTGEEPYSIAMTFMEAGLASSNFYIDAVDISDRVLASARKGIYRKNSFRTKDLTFRDRYFSKVGDAYQIKDMVRKKVRFFQGNMLEPSFLKSIGHYDVVFCRNVLIYFNKQIQKQAVGSLYNLLTPGGLLFTGYSEASLFIETTRFIPVSHAKTFAFYKKSVEPFKTVPQYPVKSNTSADKRPRPKPPSVEQYFALPRKPEKDEYGLVRRCADEGELDEAASRCEKYLRLNGPSAKWYCLLGIIRDSQGLKDEAVKLLRKAVYLDPDNVDSLIQLSLLAEHDGDIERAENYKRRARKLKEGGK